MDPLSTPTTASPRAFQRFSFDDISITSSTADEFFDADSFIYNPSFALSEASIASYKTERTINSRKSRYNALPRHKYAGTERLKLPRGPVSLDVDGATDLETDLRDESDEATKATRTRDGSMEAHQPGPRLIQEYEAPIIQTVERFRFLVVGRSGVEKSFLIKRVFGINTTDHQPRAPDIQQELVSPQNQYFVLHESEDFGSGNFSNFRSVRRFLEQRSRQELPLSERIHGIWLCTVTPTTGGRVFETGVEELLKFAHKKLVPVVVVFTQYDRLVRTKRAELKQDYQFMDDDTLNFRSVEEAWKATEICLQPLRRTTRRLGIEMPPYARVSVRPDFQAEISELLQVTRSVVKERFEGSACVLWGESQGTNLPVKIEACITKGVGYYRRALSGSAPELGRLLLRDCLGKVHKDIISCWDFKDEVLNGSEFQQLMLCLVQDIPTKPTTAIFLDVDTISQFVTLVTSASAPIFPPIAIIGTTYVFVQWLSTAILEKEPSVQRLLIAYTVDLIRILRELFDINLRSELALKITWKELQEAIVACEQFGSRQRIHNRICSTLPLSGPVLTADGISSMVHELLQDSSS